MPITTEIDHQRSLVIAVATGIVGQKDFVTLLHETGTSGAASYSHLFNALNVQLDLSIQDLHQIARKAREWMSGEPIPKVAVVSDNFYISALAQAYGVITKAQNPQFRIFKNVDVAMKWLIDDDSR